MREEIEVLEHHANFTTHFIDLLEVVGQFDVVDDDLALLVFFRRLMQRIMVDLPEPEGPPQRCARRA